MKEIIEILKIIDGDIDGSFIVLFIEKNKGEDGDEI